MYLMSSKYKLNNPDRIYRIIFLKDKLLKSIKTLINTLTKVLEIENYWQIQNTITR